MLLPVKMGGMGIPGLSDLAVREYSTSVLVTKNLVDTMRTQRSSENYNEDVFTQELNQVLQQRSAGYKDCQENLLKTLDKHTSRLLEQASEAGSSNWLSCLPLKRYGFILSKSEFRESLRIRYGKDLTGTPSNCACGSKFDVTHALNCPRGGFITIRHNEVRDFLAQMISQVQNDVETEPHLQPLDGEQLSLRSALVGDQARPDIRARGFYRAGQHAFFDVKVINPNSNSYLDVSTKKAYDRAEKHKIRCYSERIINVEHGSFVPLIFSTTGGMGVQARTFTKLLCNKISYKNRQNYNDVINYFRTKLSFLLRKLILLCIRGSRSINKNLTCIDSDNDFGYIPYRTLFSRLHGQYLHAEDLSMHN